MTDTLPQSAGRHLPWGGCFNVRDLGGLPIEGGGETRWRTLLRSDNLCRLTDEGQQALRDYGVRTIIDVRLPDELEKQPHPFAAGGDGAPRYVSISLMDETDPDVVNNVLATMQMEEQYRTILERYGERVARVIKAAARAEQEGGVLVHCHSGKDRTGIVTALLLSIAGVPRDVIAEDYVASSIYLKPIHDGWINEKPRTEEEIASFYQWFYSPAQAILGPLAYLDERFGGVESYLLAAGVTEDELAAIRQRLVSRQGDE